jgi:type II secretory pathway component PulF
MSERISKERMRFWKALGLMLQSGVPVLKTLEIALQEADEQLKSIALEMRGSAENGLEISYAMEKHSEVFSAFEISMVKVGEMAGDVGAVAEDIAEAMQIPDGRLHFWRVFGLTVRSGVPILQALEVASQGADGKIKTVVPDIAEGIKSLRGISDMMEKHPGTFSAFEIAMVRAGESTGNLSTVAERIESFLR